MCSMMRGDASMSSGYILLCVSVLRALQIFDARPRHSVSCCSEGKAAAKAKPAAKRVSGNGKPKPPPANKPADGSATSQQKANPDSKIEDWWAQFETSVWDQAEADAPKGSQPSPGVKSDKSQSQLDGGGKPAAGLTGRSASPRASEGSPRRYAPPRRLGVRHRCCCCFLMPLLLLLLLRLADAC
jgi:hypothetical protein